MPSTHKLIIFANTPNSPVQWSVEHNKRLTPLKENYLPDINLPTKTAFDLYFVLPELSCTHLTTRLPTTGKKYQEKAALYAIEDKVATPLEQIHLTLGKKNNQGETPILITDKLIIKHWRDELALLMKKYTLKWHTVIPMCLLLNKKTNGFEPSPVNFDLLIKQLISGHFLLNMKNAFQSPKKINFNVLLGVLIFALAITISFYY